VGDVPAVFVPNPKSSGRSVEAEIFQRKWSTAVSPVRPLPPFEEIVLGSLGRLARNLIVVEKLSTGDYKVIQCGRALAAWIGHDAERKLVDHLHKDLATPLTLVLEDARLSGKPVLKHARPVRDGMVETVEFLALPLSCRWNKTLLAAHVLQVGVPFNLVDTIFRSTEEGILALAAVRDAAGKPVDYQIVAFNAGAAHLLGEHQEHRWSTLSNAGGGLDTPVMRRNLLAALESGQQQKFEQTVTLHGHPIHLSIGVAAVGDLISATLTDITDIRHREESFRLLFEENPVPMLLYEPESLRITSVNDAALAHYGYARKRFLAMTLPDMWPADEHDLHRPVAQAVKDNYL
jgi:PAS domain-containing protein